MGTQEEKEEYLMVCKECYMKGNVCVISMDEFNRHPHHCYIFMTKKELGL